MKGGVDSTSRTEENAACPRRSYTPRVQGPINFFSSPPATSGHC